MGVEAFDGFGVAPFCNDSTYAIDGTWTVAAGWRKPGAGSAVLIAGVASRPIDSFINARPRRRGKR